MAAPFPFSHFLKLHDVLLTRMLFFDLFLSVAGAIFLTVPLDTPAVSLDNLAFLVLSVVLAVVCQIHVFRTGAGGIVFYLNLPVKRYWLHLLLFGDTVFPLSGALAIALAASLFVTLPGTPDRVVGVAVILFIIKAVPLPLLALYKKHMALVPLFLFLLIAIHMVISFAAEFLHLPGMLRRVLFCAGVETVCIRIVSSAKIN